MPQGLSADESRVATAMEIAREAGAILLDHLGKVAIESKGEADLVTAADRNSESHIMRRLRERYPADSIVAEEGSAAQGDSGYCWYVDPLDGTTNFAHRIPFFAVSLGLTRGKTFAGGVVYNPVLKEMFHAAAGGGARLNGVPIHVSEVARLSDALLATGFPSRKRHQNPNVHFYHALTMHSQGVRRLGSASLDLCYTACGRFDGFWEFNLKPWDTAGGCIVVTEAGGAISDMMGRPYSLESPEVLASNGLIHEGLVKEMGDIFAGRAPELPSAPAYRDLHRPI